MKNNRGKKKVGARASVSGAGAEQERLRKRCERHRFGWACFLSLLVVFLAGLLGPGMAADGISALSKAVRSVSFVQAQIVGVRLSHNASEQFSPGNGLFADPFQASFCPLHTATGNQTVPPLRTSVRPLFAGKIHFPPVFSSGWWRRWNALSLGNAPKDRFHNASRMVQLSITIGSNANGSEADELIIQLWPLTDYEFAATIKALWWYGHCSTVGSCRRLICSWVNSGIDAVSKKVGKVASRDFKLMYDPRIVHKVMYDGVMDVIQRHVGPTGGRVHQMFPAEIREGLGALSPQIARHMLIGSYVSLMSTVARRNPTMATLRWRELSFVKTASMIDGKLHHIFGTVIRWTSEKNMDMHGMRISSVDPSGDENCVEDANVVSSSHDIGLYVLWYSI
eukprot:gene1106-3943_t